MNDIKREELQNITDYKELLHFDYSGNVTAYANNNGIIIPIGSFHAFETIKNLPYAGSDKNHKCFTLETLIENDNTFEEYIEHLILIKADVLTYLNDLLLHESIHFCGSGGSNTLGAGAFMEGLNEYLTRHIAK